MTKTFKQQVIAIQCDQRCSPHKIANCIYREADKCCPDIQSPVDRILSALWAELESKLKEG